MVLFFCLELFTLGLTVPYYVRLTRMAFSKWGKKRLFAFCRLNLQLQIAL